MGVIIYVPKFTPPLPEQKSVTAEICASTLFALALIAPPQTSHASLLVESASYSRYESLAWWSGGVVAW